MKKAKRKYSPSEIEYAMKKVKQTLEAREAAKIKLGKCLVVQK